MAWFRAIAIAATTVAFALCAGAAEDPSVPVTEPVAGQSHADWVKAWWLWSWSFGEAQGPGADETGALCAEKQSGPVWFLAGAKDNSPAYGHPVVRSCTIPKERYVFFPVMVYIVAGNAYTCDEAKDSAAELTAELKSMFVEVDGVPLPQLTSHRVKTERCFDAGAKMEPPDEWYPAAANGYYVMLKPLSPGKHTLKFGGEFENLSQNMTYMLTIE